MKRRKAIRLITLGLVGGTIAHPKSRRKIVQVGRNAFDAYLKLAITLSEKKKIDEKNMADFRPGFNFSSKEEEAEFAKELLTSVQNRRIAERQLLNSKILEEELIRQLKKLTQRRVTFAKDLLGKSSFEGKPFTKQDVERELIQHMELNRRARRVPSEKEIIDIIENGAKYELK